MGVTPTDELPHPDAIDEWVFSAWTADAATGVVSGHRLIGRRAWYWSALVQAGEPLLHLTEWEVPVRSDPFVLKAPELWAEHHCIAALEQWSIANEAYFVALEDPADALGRAYGTPTAMAMDLEWYAVAPPDEIDDGFAQAGVVHGQVEIAGRPTLELVEAPAWRWRRWTEAEALAPLVVPRVVAHTGLRAPFAFPDGSVTDWVLSRSGWRSRSHAR